MVVIYPNTAPITPSDVVIGYGKKVVKHKPINISGNRYMSGIILWRISAMLILVAKNIAKNIKIM